MVPKSITDCDNSQMDTPNAINPAIALLSILTFFISRLATAKDSISVTTEAVAASILSQLNAAILISDDVSIRIDIAKTIRLANALLVTCTLLIARDAIANDAIRVTTDPTAAMS